jgi:RNA polymerase sigma-70 factor (sigma-E family)
MIGQRERAAFDSFVASCSDRLVRTAYLLSGDRGHAEDLVQTALMRTARHWRRARSSPEAYARRVVVNLAKDRWRDRARRPAEVPLDAEPQAPEAAAILDRDMLARAMSRLPHGQRAVLVLRFFDDLSVAEAAAALGCTPGTVKSQTARALSSLRAALNPSNDKEKADADR